MAQNKPEKDTNPPTVENFPRQSIVAWASALHKVVREHTHAYGRLSSTEAHKTTQVEVNLFLLRY